MPFLYPWRRTQSDGVHLREDLDLDSWDLDDTYPLGGARKAVGPLEDPTTLLDVQSIGGPQPVVESPIQPCSAGAGGAASLYPAFDPSVLCDDQAPQPCTSASPGAAAALPTSASRRRSNAEPSRVRMPRKTLCKSSAESLPSWNSPSKP